MFITSSFKKKYLFIYFCLHWVFVTVRRPSLVAESRGHFSLRCSGFSIRWPLLLQSMGSRLKGSVVVAHGPSCSAARRILPEQGSNPCPLHWQADSKPQHHQRSPYIFIFNGCIIFQCIAVAKFLNQSLCSFWLFSVFVI